MRREIEDIKREPNSSSRDKKYNILKWKFHRVGLTVDWTLEEEVSEQEDIERKKGLKKGKSVSVKYRTIKFNVHVKFQKRSGGEEWVWR